MASGDQSRSGAQRRLDDFNAAHARRKLLYYEMLEVPEDASQTQIISAYRRLSLKFHPDKPGGSNEKFQQLSKAYKCLKDEDSRRRYNECGFDEDNFSTDEIDQFVDAFFGEAARSVDGKSPDWNMGKVENYVRIDLQEVPLHMKDIVRIGLEYMASLEQEFRNVLLLQHARVDILYLMLGLVTDAELSQGVFESEACYAITYYDNPLQPGIAPRWSDQNRLDGRAKRQELPRRELNEEEFQRRFKIAQAMLENAPPDPMAALEEKYRAQMIETEREARRVADVNRCKALDLYEEDAELDCNEYAGMVSRGSPSPAVAAGEG